MNKHFLLIKTLPRLGLVNIGRVLAYKVGIRLGLNPVFKLQADPLPENSLFYRGDKEVNRPDLPARQGWVDWEERFGLKANSTGVRPPNWHKNSITDRIANSDKPWHQLSDFDNAVGDIKGIWEASRMDWVLALAQHAAKGDKNLLERLNLWINDWCGHNPPYFGVNWKCGQEASIRVMHLIMAAYILDEWERPEPALVQLIKVHLQRIVPTIMYAVAQDNNHGTSEAAALFIAGSWLEHLGDESGASYAKKGRKWLENRANRLILPDGTFSQYSVNYHRVMLDTYSWTEVWRNALELEPFTDELYQRLQLATDWLANMVMNNHGDAPVQGANDGARLIPLTDTAYRDYRPSVQLATAVFHYAAAYTQEGSYDLPLSWLKLSKPAKIHNAVKSQDYPSGGYAILRAANANASVLFRYPVCKFRPSSGDSLHVDLWLSGRNILCDSGSYSYNTQQAWLDYFKSAKAHNTIQFDDREAMPRISRFLVGEWLNCHVKEANLKAENQKIKAGYKDYKGVSHVRSVDLSENLLVINDDIAGFEHKAVLRWRLAGNNWHITGNTISNGSCSIEISLQNSDEAPHLELSTGWISKHYSEKSEIQVLEVTVTKPCTIQTHIKY